MLPAQLNQLQDLHSFNRPKHIGGGVYWRLEKDSSYGYWALVWNNYQYLFRKWFPEMERAERAAIQTAHNFALL